ncbi:MAG: hypothetical protein ABFC67_05955 [Mizugakiibacter sp.]|uniref:hypothetical protein n=1 Tax=Mizugakiibacter sp. TaxID=1972610 RepID=UPI00320FB78E
MSFLDNLFGSSNQTTKSSTTSNVQLPAWVDNAAQTNYRTAQSLASRPYTPYPFQRIADFSGDQNNAMGMLRNFAPKASAGAEPFKAPRLIDDIGPGGSIDAYMSPYVDQVLNRTQQRIRQATDMSRQWNSNMSAHQAGAFGDARHGIADAQIEERGIQAMGDASAEAYASAYDNAQGLRQFDIGNLFNNLNMNQQQQQAFLEYIDALYRSGSNQQALDQRSMELGYQDFLAQRDYPLEQFNLLVSGLNQSPYGRTVTESSRNTTPGPSTAGQILGTVGNLASLFI